MTFVGIVFGTLFAVAGLLDLMVGDSTRALIAWLIASIWFIAAKLGERRFG